MKIGRSYKQHPIPADAKFDAIVIGSGIGGLACAGLLARHAKQRVLVLERHYTAGGFTHTFTRPGFEWDVGVHYIGAVNRPRTLLRRAFDHLSDGELGWEDLGEVVDVFSIAGQRYDFPRGRENYRRTMHGYFPGEARAIDRYLALVKKTVQRSKFYFLEKALPEKLARVAGPLLRWRTLRDSKRTVNQVLDGITKNPRLRGVLCGQYGDYGLPPGEASWFMHALLVDHYLSGAAYPIGGSSRFAETLIPGIERAGGLVMTSADVAEIVLEDGRAVGVRMADGKVIRAASVISNAGWAVTFGRLVPPAASARAGISVKVPGVGPSLSHISLYVGLDATAAELKLPKANLWVYPGDDHDRNVARYFGDPKAPLPVAYLSFPSAKDPDFSRRFPGKGTIEVIGVAPWEWFARWQDTRWGKRGADYEAFKLELAARLREVLEREYPQVKGHIVHAELSTPLSTRNFAAHPQGEIYGLTHTPARFAARELRPATKIPGLYLTGSDICTAGVGGALMGGVLTATVIGKRNMLGAILKAPTHSAPAHPVARAA